MMGVFVSCCTRAAAIRTFSSLGVICWPLVRPSHYLK